MPRADCTILNGLPVVVDYEWVSASPSTGELAGVEIQTVYLRRRRKRKKPPVVLIPLPSGIERRMRQRDWDRLVNQCTDHYRGR